MRARARILAALAGSPGMHVNTLAAAIGCEYFTLSSALRHMRELGTIIVVGHCGELGIVGVRTDAPVYALPGMPMLAAKPVKPSKGSGVVGMPARGREWRPLSRDLWDRQIEHMKLAMLTRKA